MRLGIQGHGAKMANHPNRSQSTRKDAQAAGYFVREGAYQGTTDDQLGRYYVGKEGKLFCPWGAGFRTQREAWSAAAEQARAHG